MSIFTNQGKFRKCNICGEYGWANIHKCPPLWLTTNADQFLTNELKGDLIFDWQDYKETYASDEEQAAKKFWSQMPDWYEYGEEMNVLVMKPDDIEENEEGKPVWPKGKYRNFHVICESEPAFYAKEITEA